MVVVNLADMHSIRLKNGLGLDEAGYILTVDSDGRYKKCPVDGRPMYVAAKSSKNPITGEVETGVNIPAIPWRKGFVVYLQVASDNQAFDVGAPLCIDSATDGVVDYRDGTNEDGEVIAIALESKAANAGGKVKAFLV